MPAVAIRVSREDLCETHSVGTDTPERIIAPEVSPLMHSLHIGLAGVSDAGEGFRMVRPRAHYGHVLACWSGYGEVLVDGKWQKCGPGMAYLTAPSQMHAYHTVPGVRWEFAWVWWHLSNSGEPPMIECRAPMLVRADTGYLRDAIMGLYRESMGPAQPTALDNWVELLHAYVVRLGQTERSQCRGLISLWEQVDENLANPWTAKQLADL